MIIWSLSLRLMSDPLNLVPLMAAFFELLLCLALPLLIANLSNTAPPFLALPKPECLLPWLVASRLRLIWVVGLEYLFPMTFFG